MSKILLLGKSGSGKDFFLKEATKLGYKSYPKTTTRPMRVGEIDGIDYNFTNNEVFEKMLGEGDFIFHQCFKINDEIWYYGLSKESFINSDIIIVTPDELKQIENNQQYIKIYLNIDKEIRKDRIIQRNDLNDSVYRRLESDDKDFKYFVDYDFVITDPNFNVRYIIKALNTLYR